MQPTFNINGLIPIKTTNPNPNAAPLRHTKDGVFKISQMFFSENRLDLYGVNLHRSQDGKVYFEICEESQATLLKTRKGSSAKGSSFTSHPLKGFLKSPDGQDYAMALVHVDEQTSRKFFEVTPQGEATPDTDESSDAQTVAEDEGPGEAAVSPFPTTANAPAVNGSASAEVVSASGALESGETLSAEQETPLPAVDVVQPVADDLLI